MAKPAKASQRPQKDHRSFEEKFNTGEQALRPGVNMEQLAKEAGVGMSTLYAWRRMVECRKLVEAMMAAPLNAHDKARAAGAKRKASHETKSAAASAPFYTPKKRRDKKVVDSKIVNDPPELFSKLAEVLSTKNIEAMTADELADALGVKRPAPEPLAIVGLPPDLVEKLQTAARAADVNPLAYLLGLIDKAGSQPPEAYSVTFYVDASVSAGKFVDMEAIGKQMLNAAMIVRATDGKEWPYGRIIGFSVCPVKPQ